MLSSLFIFFSCSGAKLSNRAPSPPIEPVICIEIVELTELVTKDWESKEGTNIFIAKNDFLTILQRDYQACITTLNKTEIIKLLGTPSVEEIDLLKYFINNDCNKLFPKQSCISLNFIVEPSTKKILGIYELPLQSTWH